MKNCAGIDVHKMMVIPVRKEMPEGDILTREFGTFRKDRELIANSSNNTRSIRRNGKYRGYFVHQPPETLGGDARHKNVPGH